MVLEMSYRIALFNVTIGTVFEIFYSDMETVDVILFGTYHVGITIVIL